MQPKMAWLLKSSIMFSPFLSPKSWIASLIALSLLYSVGVCVYRLVYHPLAKYPGPLAAKLTDFYAAYHAYVGDIHLCMKAAHDKYGEIVRFGPNRILSNTNVGLHDIYGPLKNVKKSKGYLPILPAPGAFSVHTSIDKEMHRRKRRLISQGLGEDALKAFESELLTHIRLFCDKLAEDKQSDNEGWTLPKHMTDWCNYLTFDVMGEFGFGRAFRMLKDPENRFIIHGIAASNVRTAIYAQYPQLAKFKLEKILYPNGTRIRQKFLNVTREFAETRTMLNKNHKRDLFSFVVEAKDPETKQGFSLEELWSESKFLIVAGSDTSSTVLASIFFYLTHFPYTYDSLAREIRSKFSSFDDIVGGQELASCTYLRACIYEAMRITPPAGGAMWREVDRGGAHVDGEYIPSGYDVGTSMYAIHHNEAYFPDSYNFLPERWIPSPNGPSREEVERAQSAWNPFSLGPRGCVGRGLAMAEISLTMARVLWRFDFRKARGELGQIGEGIPGVRTGRHRVNEFQLEDHLTGIKNGPWIEFRERME